MSTTATTITTTTTLPFGGSLCLSAVAAGNLPNAASACALEAGRTPANPVLALLAAGAKLATGVLAVPSRDALLSASGITTTGSVTDVCGLRVTLPSIVPNTAPGTGTLIALARDQGLAVLDQALAILNAYSGGTASFDVGALPSCVNRGTSLAIEVDAADVLAARGALLALEAAVHAASAYDLDLPIDVAVNRTMTPEALFTSHPLLLTQRALAGTELASARMLIRQALAAFDAAVASIEGESDDQSNDLLVLDPADRANVTMLRDVAARIVSALDGTATFDTATFPVLPSNQRLALKAFFDGAVTTLRPLVPAFTPAGVPSLCSIPDITGGGIAPDMTTQLFRDATGLECCGNGIVESDEACDPSAAGSCASNAVCNGTCSQCVPLESATETFSSCNVGVVDRWTFDVSAGQLVLVRADTTNPVSAADLCYVGSCPGTGRFLGDDDFACTFPPPSFGCPSQTFIAAAGGRCTVDVGVCSCRVAGSVDYRLDVTGTGLTLTGDDIHGSPSGAFVQTGAVQ